MTMPAHLKLLFFVSFSALVVTFCSDPVYTDDNSEKVSIDNLTIKNIVDEDQDHFYASLDLSLSVTSKIHKKLYVKIMYKESADSMYRMYDTQYFMLDDSLADSKDLLFNISSNGLGQKTGCFEFLILIYDQQDIVSENILASLSADENSNLSLCLEKVVQDILAMVTINDAWLENKVDIDKDNFYSRADLFFQLTSTAAVDVIAAVKYKRTGLIYNDYKHTSVLNIDGQSVFSIALNDTGLVLCCDSFDFLIEIYLSSDKMRLNPLASLSSGEDSDLLNVYLENQVNDKLCELIFDNEFPTEVLFDITGYGSILVDGESRDTFMFEQSPHGIVTFKAATQLAAGGNISWMDSVDFSWKKTEYYRLLYGPSKFFAWVTNNGGSARTDFYINRGLRDEYHLDITIPNDGIAYPLGYYNAHENTQIWSWSVGAQNWTAWINLGLQDIQNQVVYLNTTLPLLSPSADESAVYHK